jgi:hypothetical protein
MVDGDMESDRLVEEEEELEGGIFTQVNVVWRGGLKVFFFKIKKKKGSSFEKILLLLFFLKLYTQ